MTTTTTLVHRASSGPIEWWRDPLVYEIASPELSADDVAGARWMLDHVASLGCTAVVLRPSLMDVAADMEPFAAFARSAHEMGLRVCVRVSGAMGPVTGPRRGADDRFIVGCERSGDGLVERAEAFLAAGADGIDVGTVIPPEVDERTDLARLTSYFTRLHAAVAAHVEDGIVGADVSADYPDTMRHHLQEDWLHHLRDDALTLTRWDVESLTRHLTLSFAEHDRFGAPPVWRYLPSYVVRSDTDPGDGRRWFDISGRERRRRALALQALMLALPGSVYMRQGDEIALLDEDKPSSPTELAALVGAHAHTQGSEFGSPLATVRHGVRVRRDKRLATSTLAFVTGLPWCPAQAMALLVRDVVVMVNMTSQPVALPEHAVVVLSSQQLEQRHGQLEVPPTTTVWLDAATVS